MRIVLTGATGFVGRALTDKLIAAGHEVAVPVRNPERARRLLPAQVRCLPADPASAETAEALQGCGALIHLAGESVAGGRWSAARRRRIHDSRGPAMRRLLEAATAGPGTGPGMVISASAVGYYGDRGDEELTESSALGTGFLAELCRDWEDALLGAAGGDSRRVALRRVTVLRIGMVLGRRGGAMTPGGAMARLPPVFRAGLGGRLGSGRQWMSWIHLEDLTELILFALQSPKVSGVHNAEVFNAVAPGPVTNREFTETLASLLHRPAILHAPAFALRLALGQMSSILLHSQRVVPAAALAQGFTFRYQDLRAALEEVCAKGT